MGGEAGGAGGCWGAIGWGQECCEAPEVLGVAQDRGTCSLGMPRSQRRVLPAVKISTCPGQCQTPGPARDDKWWCPLVSPDTGTGHFTVLTSPIVFLLLGTPTTYSVRDESPECPRWDIEGGMGIGVGTGIALVRHGDMGAQRWMRPLTWHNLSCPLGKGSKVTLEPRGFPGPSTPVPCTPQPYLWFWGCHQTRPQPPSTLQGDVHW